MTKPSDAGMRLCSTRKERTSLSPPISASPPPSPLSHARGPGLAFLILCVLVALDLTSPLDWWGQTLLTSPSSALLDLLGALLSVAGELHMTGALAVVLACRGWQRHRAAGLGPVLLFVGVGLELLLKYVLPHPGPYAVFSHPHAVPSFLRFVEPLMLHVSTPYSFPSGHMLRTTFLVVLVSAHQPRWRRAGWVLVGCMAITRVYGNEHWLSDVLGGTLLGWTLAMVAIALEGF